jgi:hypothetical protein
MALEKTRNRGEEADTPSLKEQYSFGLRLTAIQVFRNVPKPTASGKARVLYGRRGPTGFLPARKTHPVPISVIY